MSFFNKHNVFYIILSINNAIINTKGLFQDLSAIYVHQNEFRKENNHFTKNTLRLFSSITCRANAYIHIPEKQEIHTDV